jgi:hypothetical protein
MRHPRTRFAATISRWLSLRWRRLRFSAATADEIYPVRQIEKAAKARQAFASATYYRVENGPQRDHKPPDVTPQAAIGRPGDKWVIMPMYKAELGGQTAGIR